jgi:hypothetical protein
VFLIGAWVALVVAIVFFVIGFCWYYGQTVLRQYLHAQGQTTALAQLSHRLGSTNESILTAETEQATHSKSLPIEHQTASSDEDDECKTDSAINVLPPIAGGGAAGMHKRISFIHNVEETEFHTSSTGNIVCTITPGLGVFLTTSSRHTPHVFERVLARIHAVC